LLRWLDERRKSAAEPINTHHLDRKAEGVEDHLDQVSVPPVVPAEDDAR
jgi:hypothetical protein